MIRAVDRVYVFTVDQYLILPLSICGMLNMYF